MTLSKLYEIFVPTYNRPNPAILKMLDRDSALKLNFCVRDEAYLLPEYIEIQKKYGHQVSFINIGKNIHDIGETRNRILEFAQANDIKYCVMIDDGITDFYTIESKSLLPSDVIYMAVDELDHRYTQAKLHGTPFSIAQTFRRKNDKFVGVADTDTMLCGMMQQAYVINCELAKQHNIKFKSLKKVGFEDAAFMLDAFKAGLITTSSPVIFMNGKQPNVVQKGGNHDDLDIEKFAKSYDKKSLQLAKYIGCMYGVSFEKKYRKRYNAAITYCIVNYGYFRDVFKTKTLENEKIIKSHFIMK